MTYYFPGTCADELQNGGVEVDSVMEVDSQEADGTVTQTRNAKKRPPPSSDEDEEDINDRLLPAAAAMKRRRIEEEKQAQRRGVSPEPSSGTTKMKPEPPTKKPKPRKEVNIQDVVRERREAEDEAARRDEETLTLDGADIESMRNLAVVEEMELPDRPTPARRRDANGDGAHSDRWDERWNGRKNFKKFRRGGEGEARRRGPSVIVPLEEVKKKSQGIGEEYWLGSEKTTQKRKEKEKEGASPMEMEDSQPFTTARSQHVHTEEVPAEPASGEEADVIDVDAPRRTRLGDVTSQSQSQADSNRTTTLNGKRPAPAGVKGGAPKKQKVLKAVDEGSDSDDELKFRFKKRR